MIDEQCEHSECLTHGYMGEQSPTFSCLKCGKLFDFDKDTLKLINNLLKEQDKKSYDSGREDQKETDIKALSNFAIGLELPVTDEFRAGIMFILKKLLLFIK